ncbi:MAG: sugar phosphate isomerase/epimerase family protein [Balneolaceae bacterium]
MMKRADFLKLGTAGLAGAAMPPVSVSGTQQERIRPHRLQGMPLRKALMLGTFPNRGDYTLMEQFEMLRDAGFDGVEPGSGLNREEVLAAREATGLEIPSVVVSTHWSQPLSSSDPSVREAGVEGLKTALYDAHEYDAGCVLLVPGVVNAEVSYDQAYRRSRYEIEQVLPLAEELNVVIAIENVWNHFLLSPMEAARYVDEFHSPWVGWYFDIGNILNYGWAYHWIRILGDRIVMIHIKEYSRQLRDEEGLWRGFRANLTEGDNNWPEIMKALEETGYSGYAIAEPAYREPDVSDADWLREYVSGRMDRIFQM